LKGRGEKIDLNPEVLKTLRENSGYTVEELARKLDVRGEKIERVERGEDYFALRQIKRLSGIYRVPLAAFFSDSVPHIPSLPDYRVTGRRESHQRLIWQ